MSASNFVVIDHDNDNEREAETRQQAEEMAETAREFGSDDVEIVTPDDADTEPEVIDVTRQHIEVPSLHGFPLLILILKIWVCGASQSRRGQPQLDPQPRSGAAACGM